MDEDSTEYLRKNPGLEEEWIRQNNLSYGGLIGVGLIMVQPFLTAESLDLSARICVVAFSMAIPLLAALVLVSRQEAFRRRVTRSRLVTVTRSFAQACAFVGLVAAFWHMLWLAGVGILVAGVVGMGVHSAGYTRLEGLGRKADPGAKEPEG